MPTSAQEYRAKEWELCSHPPARSAACVPLARVSPPPTASPSHAFAKAPPRRTAAWSGRGHRFKYTLLYNIVRCAENNGPPRPTERETHLAGEAGAVEARVRLSATVGLYHTVHSISVGSYMYSVVRTVSVIRYQYLIVQYGTEYVGYFIV